MTPEMQRYAAECEARAAHWARNERIASCVIYACGILFAGLIACAFAQ